jgi:phage tail protein X
MAFEVAPDVTVADALHAFACVPITLGIAVTFPDIATVAVPEMAVVMLPDIATVDVAVNLTLPGFAAENLTVSPAEPTIEAYAAPLSPCTFS